MIFAYFVDGVLEKSINAFQSDVLRFTAPLDFTLDYSIRFEPNCSKILFLRSVTLQRFTCLFGYHFWRIHFTQYYFEKYVKYIIYKGLFSNALIWESIRESFSAVTGEK